MEAERAVGSGSSAVFHKAGFLKDWAMGLAEICKESLHMTVCMDRIGWYSRRTLPAGAPERWAEDRGVCLPYYLPAKTISRFILFSSGMMLCEDIEFSSKQTNKTKGTEGKCHKYSLINISWRSLK